MKVLGLIPARGGSKGIPEKNKKILGNKPLISYTIEAAKASSLVDVVLSSDDLDIMTIAQEHGIEVPFQRPVTLAQDKTPSIDVVLHVLDFLEAQGRHYDAVCLLQPTSPFRADGFIDKALQTFIDGGFDAVVSMLEVPHQFNPHWVFKEGNDGLKISTGDAQLIPRRQELPPAYYRDGSVYVTSVKTIRSGHFIGKKTGFILSNPETHVNIDTPKDWETAEQLLKTIPH